MGALKDFTLKDIDGAPLPLSRYDGKVVLLVNVASKCGLTPQYEGLEALWREGREMGLVVVGLPCNQFGAQEPGTPEQIKEFCSLSYDVSFPSTEKIEVNGARRHPLYQWLAGASSKFPGDIRWNFEKFLIGRDGHVIERFAPDTEPQDAGLKSAIAKALD